MDSSDDDVLIAFALHQQILKKKSRKRKWVHEICKKRYVHGEYHTLFPLLLRDPSKFFNYFRMSYENFQKILNLVKEDLSKENTSFRRSIDPEERLAVCLRFLATGDSMKTISLSYRLGYTTVRNIIHETCKFIWIRLSPIVLPVPTTEMWKNIEEKFNTRWNFPNCIGALDGKHITIEAPSNSGSLYFNYKKTFSVVLMALVDANYKFIFVDVGAYGKNSDGGILASSQLGKALNGDKLHLPSDKPLPGTVKLLPHVIVGDEAFPLQKNIMRPYPGNQLRNDESKKIFNYRLSRARRISENAFGILTQKFRIYQIRIKLKVENVDNVILATCCLHNFLIGDIHPIAVNDSNNTAEMLKDVTNISNHVTAEAMSIRDDFRKFFTSAEGSVPWQTEMVRRGRISE